MDVVVNGWRNGAKAVALLVLLIVATCAAFAVGVLLVRWSFTVAVG